METITIKKLAAQIRGVSYKPEDLHDSLDETSVILLRANNIDEGRINFDDVVFVDRKKVSPEQFLKKGDILICASSGSKNLVGKAAPVEFEKEVTFGAFCKVVRPNSANDAEYISMFFQSPIYRREISSVALGANINNIRKEHIDQLAIKWPPFEERYNAVEVLSKGAAIIQRRKKELQQLDDLIKARFVEMFGDPILNDHEWAQISLLESLEKGRTVSYGIVQTGDDFEDGVPVFRPVDIAGGRIPNRNELKRTDPQISAQYKRTLLKGNELLITVRGSVGETFQTTPEFEGCNVGRNIVPLVSDKGKIEQRFLQELFAQDAVKQWLKGITKGIALQGLNMSEFKEMPVIVPPLSLQQTFTRFAIQVDNSKFAVQKALDEAQTLFDSLMQKYFG